MSRTLTNTHRLGYQPGRARVVGAIGSARHGRPSTTWTAAARQANALGASPAVCAFDGILAVPTMWTKCTARHLATRPT
jgi:hypothetical protein